MCILFTCITHADEYTMNKQKVKQKLIGCMNASDDRAIAQWNNCVTNAANNFKNLADVKMKNRIKEESFNAQGLYDDIKIYHTAINQCEQLQELSFQGFSYSAQCELRRAQDYYRYAMSSEIIYPSKWTEMNRIDNLYITF